MNNLISLVQYLPKLKSSLAFSLSLMLVNSGQVVLANTRTIYAQDAQGVQSKTVELRVWKGYGVTINLIPTGEIIKQVWIGDPSRISFTSNGDLCPKDASQDCHGGATVLFLRQIQPINFPNMTSSRDGSTQITILTIGVDGQKQYQFKLIPASGQPAYTSLVIKPESERPAPLLLANRREVPQALPTPQQKLISINPESTKPEIAVTEAAISETITVTAKSSLVTGTVQRNNANAIVAGLVVAHRNGQIKSGSTTWKKVQDAIKLLRQGKSQQEAISRSGISAQIFDQLIEWGRKP
ncbi:hypothetical protein [Nostoc sp. TCL26-01]|uniref:hypothetical protein n=1 Tax=Nostoc sp. TCL26-01 TaxID=2576904 RepID=UPI0015BEC9D5|nr:hypothetical protein [Nostoc sp. TCL26-01]QLE59718.1 hypothetical protein FD725_30235 [Nostoc sp. TCL26-01]